MGSGNFRGSSPTPVIPLSYAADGDTLNPASAATPLPVSSTPALPASVTTDQDTVAVTSSSSVIKAAGVGTKLTIIVNNGANDAYFSVTGTCVSGATAVSGGGGLLKAGGGSLVLTNAGPLVISAICAAGTIFGVSLVD